MFFVDIAAFAIAVYVCVTMVQAGIPKVQGELSAVNTFQTLGGDSVRLLTGWTEILCGVLFPFLTIAGYPLLIVMFGAVFVHAKVWGNSPVNAIKMLAAIITVITLRGIS
jgi:hypothetical protein